MSLKCGSLLTVRGLGKGGRLSRGRLSRTSSLPRMPAGYDGTAYVEHCPIRAGTSFTYRFRVDEPPGTYMWWVWWGGLVGWGGCSWLPLFVAGVWRRHAASWQRRQPGSNVQHGGYAQPQLLLPSRRHGHAGNDRVDGFAGPLIVRPRPDVPQPMPAPQYDEVCGLGCEGSFELVSFTIHV